MDKWKYKVRYDSNDEIWFKITVTAIDEKMESHLRWFGHCFEKRNYCTSEKERVDSSLGNEKKMGEYLRK